MEDNNKNQEKMDIANAIRAKLDEVDQLVKKSKELGLEVKFYTDGTFISEIPFNLSIFEKIKYS